MKPEDFYQKYGHPSHWKCLEGIDDLEEEQINYKSLSTHDKVINAVEHRLKHLDDILGVERCYIKEQDYYLNKNECCYGYNGQHEVDLACIMKDRAYLFEVKTGVHHRPKAIHQLESDRFMVLRDYPNIQKIYMFYVQGRPNNYNIERII